MSPLPTGRTAVVPLTKQMLERLKSRYEAGDWTALVEALYLIGEHPTIPDWLRKALHRAVLIAIHHTAAHRRDRSAEEAAHFSRADAVDLLIGSGLTRGRAYAIVANRPGDTVSVDSVRKSCEYVKKHPHARYVNRSLLRAARGAK